jgi:hypothetical protein
MRALTVSITFTLAHRFESASTEMPRRVPGVRVLDHVLYDCLGLWPPLPALDARNEAWVDRVATALA